MSRLIAAALLFLATPTLAGIRWLNAFLVELAR
jgi:hypothetical protein